MKTMSIEIHETERLKSWILHDFHHYHYYNLKSLADGIIRQMRYHGILECMINELPIVARNDGALEVVVHRWVGKNIK